MDPSMVGKLFYRPEKWFSGVLHMIHRPIHQTPLPIETLTHQNETFKDQERPVARSQSSASDSQM